MAWLLVGIGGAIGAMLRYGIGVLAAHLNLVQFPVATVVVNTLGSFIIGVCYIWVFERADLGEQFRLFAMVGVLGGFTTFSAFSLDTLLLLEQGHYTQAIAYVVLTMVLALSGVILGAALMRIF